MHCSLKVPVYRSCLQVCIFTDIVLLSARRTLRMCARHRSRTGSSAPSPDSGQQLVHLPRNGALLSASSSLRVVAVDNVSDGPAADAHACVRRGSSRVGPSKTSFGECIDGDCLPLCRDRCPSVATSKRALKIGSHARRGRVRSHDLHRRGRPTCRMINFWPSAASEMAQRSVASHIALLVTLA